MVTRHGAWRPSLRRRAASSQRSRPRKRRLAFLGDGEQRFLAIGALEAALVLVALEREPLLERQARGCTHCGERRALRDGGALGDRREPAQGFIEHALAAGYDQIDQA